MKSFFGFLGRLLLSALFIGAGINKVMNFDDTAALLSQGLSSSMDVYGSMPLIGCILGSISEYSKELLFAGIAFEIVGGFLILLGVQVRFGALLLILFLIPTTLIFHHFWTIEGAERQEQMTGFLKNTSILGGLLLLMAYGKGSVSTVKVIHTSVPPKE